MKHFNRAFVWGEITDIEEKTTEGKGKPYIEITVNCADGEYGNVLAFGRLWGKKVIEEFKAAFGKKALVKLTGALAQYEGRNKVTKSNFSFYKVEGWDPSRGQHKHRRATFILAGEVLDYVEAGDEGELSLRVSLQAEGQEQADVKDFKLSVPSSLTLAFLDDYPKGSEVRVKGHIRQEEDDCGDVVKPARPVVAEISRPKAGEGDVPF